MSRVDFEMLIKSANIIFYSLTNMFYEIEIDLSSNIWIRIFIFTSLCWASYLCSWLSGKFIYEFLAEVLF